MRTDPKCITRRISHRPFWIVLEGGFQACKKLLEQSRKDTRVGFDN